MPFLLMFSDAPFHLEIPSTNMTLLTLFMWLSMWKRHFWQCIVKYVENQSRKTENHGTLAKRHLTFFGSQSN